MKKLKLTLFMALALISTSAMSQTFGVGAGANFSNVSFSDDDGNDDFYDGYKSIVGVNVGGFYDLDFNDNIGLRFGLKYSGKGYKYKMDFESTTTFGGTTFTDSYSTDISARLNYVQINPMFKYKKEVGSSNAFYAMVGPYLSFGVSGSQKGESTYSSSDGTSTISETSTIDEKIEFGDNGDGIDVLDFGLTPAIGFELNNIFLEASYDLGLNNIDTENDPDFRVSNRNISVTVGYVFGK